MFLYGLQVGVLIAIAAEFGHAVDTAEVSLYLD